MTPDELNKAVAEGLGWRHGTHHMAPHGMSGWWDADDIAKYSLPKFSTNLQQAVDYIMPALKNLRQKGDIVGIQLGSCNVSIFTYWSGYYNKSWLIGHGSKDSERMAWSLCELFLEELFLKENKEK